MSNYNAQKSYKEAQANGRRVVDFARKMERENRDLSAALQAIGLCLQQIALGLEEQAK
jgi:hypothetical protein